MKRLVLFVVLGLILLSVIGCSGGGGCQRSPGTVPQQPTSVLVPQSQNLVNGMITVPTSSYYDQSFSVTSSMQNARIIGSFEASGGLANDISVIIMDDMSFINWANSYQVQKVMDAVAFLNWAKEHPIQNCYHSGRVMVGNIDVSLSSGKYHLVFENLFGDRASKNVITRVDLNWSELRYQ